MSTDRLARAKEEADWHHVPMQVGTKASPDERTVPGLLLGILDALIAITDALENPATPIEPGLCWHNSGIMWSTGTTAHCELRAGHLGAHECDRGPMGGSAVWTGTTPAPEAHEGERGEG